MSGDVKAAIPRVSVIMPVYNAEKFLRHAVESILRQSLPDLELIVIDDGSTDNSMDIVLSLRDERIRYLRTPRNGGPARARNMGIEEARAPYVALLDADDVASTDRLRQQWEYLEAHPEISAVGTGLQEMDAHGNEIGPPRRFPSGSRKLRRRLAHEYPFGNPTLMFRRTSLLAVGGYRALFRAAEDYDLMLRVSEHFDMDNLPACLVRYRVHSGSLSNMKACTEAVAMRVARESARCRRTGRQDPCSGKSELTLDILQALGITDADIGSCKVEAYRSRIGRMVLTGDLAAAERILQEYDDDDIPAEVRTRSAPDIAVLRVRLLWAHRQRAQAAAMLLAGCVSSFSMCARVAAKAWWLVSRGLWAQY